MPEPDPNYPFSLFSSVLSSVFGRIVVFALTCVAAIMVGNAIRNGWDNSFHSPVITLTIVASFLSIWGALFYVVLLAFFIVFVRFAGSWIWIPLAFFVQGFNAWIMADAFK
jgi:hypothetical protein